MKTSCSRVEEMRNLFLGGTSGGSKGVRPHPYGPKISQFHAVFQKFLAKSYVGSPVKGWRPLLRGILDPTLHAEARLIIDFITFEGLNKLL